MMQKKYSTSRLVLNKLALSDSEFILELLNTPGWLQFIGDRNIRSKEDAAQYIQKITDNLNITYWTVTIKDNNTPIGLITLIKRDYLEHKDIGFAFLPQYNGKGYAYEATIAVVNDLITDPSHTKLVAITLRENTNSIALLQKAGLHFEKEIVENNETLLLYSVGTDKLALDHLAKKFFSVFSNKEGNKPDWDLIASLCLPETLIIKKTEGTEIVYNLDTFIEPRKKVLSDGTLKEFEENEVEEETKIVGNIAQRFSKYQKSGYLNDKHFHEYGNKFFQFVKTANSWKINSVIWEDINN